MTNYIEFSTREIPHMKILVIDRELTITERETSIEECYKKCNYRKTEGFEVLHTWNLSADKYIDLMGRPYKSPSQQYIVDCASNNLTDSLTLSGQNAFVLYNLNSDNMAKLYIDLSRDFFNSVITINMLNTGEKIEEEKVEESVEEKTKYEKTDYVFYQESCGESLGELVEEAYIYSDDEL